MDNAAVTSWFFQLQKKLQRSKTSKVSGMFLFWSQRRRLLWWNTILLSTILTLNHQSSQEQELDHNAMQKQQINSNLTSNNTSDYLLWAFTPNTRENFAVFRILVDICFSIVRNSLEPFVSQGSHRPLKACERLWPDDGHLLHSLIITYDQLHSKLLKATKSSFEEFKLPKLVLRLTSISVQGRDREGPV